MNKTSIKEIVNLIKEDTLKGLKGFTVKYANGSVETYENRLYTFVCLSLIENIGMNSTFFDFIISSILFISAPIYFYLLQS